jgi:hypothetical protein
MIRDLAPIRVVRSDTHVRVVENENDRMESGYYFIMPISSHIPMSERGRTFRWDEQRQLVEYRFDKKKQ